ncbi:MAG: anthranilate synthase component I [Candidatus Altiarchaeota archaeon]|nr:anthranilate synthase component I [Candidatus Altiarchaeota archaeon]
MENIQVTTLYKEITERDPEKAYKAVRGPDSYLLESCEGGEKIARYSFIGFNPAAKITAKPGKIEFKAFDPALKEVKIAEKNPLKALRGLMEGFTLKTPALSRFFGGFVGYVSYDIIRCFTELETNTVDDLKEPMCELVLAKNNVIFDHIRKKAYVLSHEFMKKGSKVDEKETRASLDRIAEQISCADNANPAKKDTNCQHKLSTFSSNITRDKFEENVRRAIEYIRAGDIFQVVLSQRLETEYNGDVFNVYKNLKKINPSPYMYCLDFGDRKIVGSSPEMLARVEKRRVETYPIAGTRPRGRTRKEDLALEKEMLEDEKERAEHVMLVDLGRNDVGRVAEFGTVNVSKFMDVEKFSHVQHMVSEVTGRLRTGMDEFDALESIFPAGTVSGAPKVRAMEIIEELETTRRGIYAGAIGYFSFNGNMDTAISIRTIIFEKYRAYIQAGAGIVADSKPEAEFQETLNKAKGLLKALETAR